MPASERESDLEYLRAIERLAHHVVETAAAEDWLTFGEEGQQSAVSLHRAINQLATELRMAHLPGDGCLDQGDVDGAEFS